MAVTLKQISKRAGVSVPTVSRILNGRETGVPIREETRNRVLAVAAELGYRPNLLARGLVGSKSSLIGVIVRDIADPFLNQILAGMYDAAVDRRYRLFLGHVGQRADTTLDYGSMFEQSHADGIIIIGDMQDDEYALQALTTQHRYVVGVTDRTSRRAFPGVYGDTVQGAQQALDHLWNLGHRRIACVSDPAISDGRRRIEVYKAFLRERGAEASTEVYEVARSFESGDQLGKAILSQPRSFTAIFATTDSLAIGLMKAAYELGIHVPSQLSLIGYDDIAIAPFTSPPLTTISQFGHEMGRQTATLLLNMIEGELESADVADVILPTRLIVRDSTGLPNGR